MNDELTYVGVEQVRIKKLVDIWERGSTFPATMLNQFKEKLNAPNANGKNLQLTDFNHIIKKIIEKFS